MNKYFVLGEDLRIAAGELLKNTDRDTLIRILDEEFGIKTKYNIGDRIR